jgi:hypothetical protein
MKNTFTNTNEIKKRLQREIILGIVFMIISLIMLAVINASAQGMGVGINPPVSTLHIYENTANTGTTAGLTIEQNGAGDPVLQYLLTGSTRWMTGIDKTDANKFKIAGNSTDVGTNTRLTIQTTGEVGIGTNSPTSLFSVGSTSQFQVNSTGVIVAATGITSSGSITFSGLSTLGIVHNSAAGLLNTSLIVNSDVTNGTIDLTTKVTGILPIANGGTALSTVPTNGQLLIGNGTNYTLGTLTAGDAITITNTAGAITIAAAEPGLTGNSRDNNLTIGQTFYSPISGGMNPTNTDVKAATRSLVWRAGHISNLFIINDANVGGCNNIATVMLNGIATTLTVTLNNVSSGNDVTHSIAVAAGDEVGIRIAVGNCGTARNWSWSVEFEK